MDEPDLQRRNKWTFSIGTVGRDMIYTLITMYLVYFMTEVLNLSDTTFAWATGLMLAARLFDAVMDIVMGSIVDNTRTRWGQYKPWIFGGMIASGLFTILLFTDMGLTDVWFIVVFTAIYVCWSLSWTTNDVPYWSLLPTLTLDQKKREQIGSLAKIFATIGTFTVVVTILPTTGAWLTPLLGAPRAWIAFVSAIVVIMIAGQCVTLIGTKVPKLVVDQQKTSVRELARAVYRNDQLLWTAIAMVLFMTGYMTTTTFGTYFFKYAYGDPNMYTPFGAVLGVAQVLGYLIFPLLRRRLNRRRLYTLAIAMIVLGYLVFFFSPMNIFIIGAAAFFLFMGQAFVTILMLVFITDTIDYGHWKLGHRNTAVTFALQPFINKVGAALATQIAAVTLIYSGINDATSPDQVTDQGLLGMKISMLIVPLVLTLISYIIYRSKYRIDEAFHDQILADLRARGQLVETDQA